MVMQRGLLDQYGEDTVSRPLARGTAAVSLQNTQPK